MRLWALGAGATEYMNGGVVVAGANRKAAATPAVRQTLLRLAPSLTRQ